MDSDTQALLLGLLDQALKLFRPVDPFDSAHEGLREARRLVREVRDIVNDTYEH